MPAPVIDSGESRVFVTPYGAGPGRPPQYDGRSRIQAVTDPGGDATLIYEPNPYEYGRFDVVGTIRGAAGPATTTLERRKKFAVSQWKRWKDVACVIDVHVPMGQCSNPDAHGDSELLAVFEQASITSYNTTDLGALDGGQVAAINESIAVSAEVFYEVNPQLRLAEIAASIVTREIISAALCDRINCGVCGPVSDGCNKVFLLSTASGGSPGLPADVLYSKDGGATWAETNVDTLGVASPPTAGGCVGSYYVVLSTASPYIHYASQDDILSAIEVWASNSAGVVGTPRALWSYASSQTWVVGTLGYVYKYGSITSTPTVQSDGSVTSQNLNAIHGMDADVLVAVGAANAVIFTTDGGTNWQSVTGPAVGVALNTVWVKDADTWFVGTAGGALWYTDNGGTTWTAISLPITATAIQMIKFNQTPSQTVGWLLATVAGPVGYVLRSLDGGASWDRLPKTGLGLTPDRFNDIALCSNVNIAYAGGLGDNGTDGIAARVA